MAIITTNTSKLPIAQKCVKGQEIITMSTDNPNAPGNAVPLARFVSAQGVLMAANAAYEACRQECRQLLVAREAALAIWTTELNGLAGVTASVTGGVAEKILSTGFGVRGEPTPTQPVGQVQNVKVTFTGEPGHSRVTWAGDDHATGYVLECGEDPNDPASFMYKASPRDPRWEGNGAVPGKLCYYRVAAVNRLGQGPWSDPAQRPVM